MGDLVGQFLATPERSLLGNSPDAWVFAAVTAAAAWAVLWLLRELIAIRYRRYLSGAGMPPIRILPDLVGATRQFFMIAVALFAAQSNLTLPARLHGSLQRLLLVLMLLQAGIWAVRSVQLLLDLKRQERGGDPTLLGSVAVIMLVSRLLIWSILILVGLENFGVNITALLAGLGVGGVAIALALQNILGDLFASLSIALDKPFIVGDSLVIDAYSGSVEKIGIKTTRLRSDSGEQIILSNADILKSRVRNYGRATELRVLCQVRVRYDTPPERLREIPGLLRAIVAAQPQARFERCHLTTLGSWALQFELSYFRLDPAAHPLLDLQHEVNCRILEELARIGVRIAVPESVALG